MKNLAHALMQFKIQILVIELISNETLLLLLLLLLFLSPLVLLLHCTAVMGDTSLHLQIFFLFMPEIFVLWLQYTNFIGKQNEDKNHFFFKKIVCCCLLLLLYMSRSTTYCIHTYVYIVVCNVYPNRPIVNR